MFHSLQVITYKKDMLFHLGTYSATLNFIDLLNIFILFLINVAAQ